MTVAVDDAERADGEHEVVPRREGSTEELHCDALTEESNDGCDVREEIVDKGVSFVVCAHLVHPCPEDDEGDEDGVVIAASDDHLDLQVRGV